MDRLRSFSLLLFIVLGTSTASLADVINLNFTDTHNYWLQGQANDWHNNSTSYGYVDDNLDVIGTPNMLNGTAALNNNQLASITINYTNGSGLEKAGDLFIDRDSDNYWDYVVKIYNAPGHAAGAAGTYDLYSAHIDARKGTSAENNSRYYLSGNDNTGIWAGYVIRDDSPYAAKESALGSVIGQVNFSGWQTVWGPNSSSFTFGIDNSLVPDLTGSQMFTLAWGPNCANDVLWEQVQLPVSPTPEPHSLILFGSALVFFGLTQWSKVRQ